MSGLFSSKKSSGPQGPTFDKIYDPFASSRAALNDFLTKEVGKPGPAYTGDRVAPASAIEQKSLEAANRYAEAPATSPTLGLAADEIKKTLSGDYDPSTSPYYQAVKAEAARNLEITNDRIKDASAGAGRYYSGARIKAQADAAANVNNQLNTTLGSIAQQERQNRLGVIPQALALDEQQSLAEAKKAQALQTIGALPRELQQAMLDALYQEFQQQFYEYPLNIAGLAAGPAQQQPIFVQQGYSAGQPSNFSKVISLFS